VLPGLIDAHGHVFGLGQMLTQLDLSGSRPR
jgi:predicted amidohydrolase YtcJ